MILTSRTVEIIKNFSQINSLGMVWPEGSTIAVDPPMTKNMLAIAEIDEYNDQRFTILDLVQFYSAISSFEKPEIELDGLMLKVSDAGEYSRGTFRLNQGSEQLIKQPKNIVFPEEDTHSFELTRDMMSRIFRSVGIVQSPQIAIVGENGEMAVKGHDPENSGINQYQMPIASTTDTFGFAFEVDQFNKLLKSTDYVVTISKRGIARFKGDRIVYYLAAKILDR